MTREKPPRLIRCILEEFSKQISPSEDIVSFVKLLTQDKTHVLIAAHILENGGNIIHLGVESNEIFENRLYQVLRSGGLLDNLFIEEYVLEDFQI